MRAFVFWIHLLVGVTAGAVILFMSATGVLLAFEPQISEWLERDRRVVTPPPAAPRLAVEALLARARAARTDQRPAMVTLRSDPSASAVVSFGREGGALFIDPYRGTVLGELSPAHAFLHEVVEWHRWLGSREMGRPITWCGQSRVSRAGRPRRLPLVAVPLDTRNRAPGHALRRPASRAGA
jgi:uncharacterized iron-regulated membrane protein